MTIREALKQANKQLSKRVDAVLNQEVFHAVQEAEIAAIQDVVYDAYDPLRYNRRYDRGGMLDPYNIEILGGSAKNGRLSVVNVTEADDRYPGSTNKTLPELIEYGHSRYVSMSGVGYDFISNSKTRRDRYMVPRPFTARTISDLAKSKGHVAAMRAGLQRQGVEVR